MAVITTAIPAGSIAAAEDVVTRKPSTIGAPGVGDTYIPYAGNGGYDVATYDLVASVGPARPAISGRWGSVWPAFRGSERPLIGGDPAGSWTD